ncbi:MAG: hypothetical protein QGG42_10310 [Phycisphaerae bacterium]|jgi:uncharacterized membrane protein|nr:hypothetical protein [Phycisphaerae bacterium]
MILLPYESWEIDSSLTVDELVAGMTSRTKPSKLLCTGSRNYASLQGGIHARGFCLHRVVHYHNSSLPHIYGRFVPRDNGTTIRVRMTFDPIVFAILVFMVGLFGIAGLVGILQSIRYAAYTFLMAGVLILLACGGFFLEAGRTQNLLSEMIENMQRKAAGGNPETDDADPNPASIADDT